MVEQIHFFIAVLAVLGVVVPAIRCSVWPEASLKCLYALSISNASPTEQI